MISLSKAQVNPEDVVKVLEQIKMTYAPDKRTAIFNIESSIKGNVLYLKGETNIAEAKEVLNSSFKNFKLVDEVALLPAEDLGDKIYAIVNLSVANVRTKPEHSAELATQVLLGSKLKVLKSHGEWYLVQCEDDYIGWMDDDGLFLMDEKGFNSWKHSKKIIVTSPFTFAYFNADKNSSHVSDVIVGNLLKMISREKNFTKVQFPDGREAFISNEEIQDYDTWIESREQTFPAINNFAHNLMGIPYVWGGTSIKGLDCSGFTKIVFKSIGVELPRDASQQVFVGELIDTQKDFDNLLPGDLLFFGLRDSTSQKTRITHVAIYLGNLEFIHASGRVRINSFDKTKSNFAENRLKTFITARRILTSLGNNGVKMTKDLNKS